MRLALDKVLDLTLAIMHVSFIPGSGVASTPPLIGGRDSKLSVRRQNVVHSRVEGWDGRRDYVRNRDARNFKLENDVLLASIWSGEWRKGKGSVRRRKGQWWFSDIGGGVGSVASHTPSPSQRGQPPPSKMLGTIAPLPLFF